MTPDDAWLRLALVPGLGPITAARLIEAADGDPEAPFRWPMDRLTSIDGIGPERARRICDPAGADAVASERAACAKAGVRIVVRGGEGWPSAFDALHDPPLAVWMQGSVEPRDRLAVAVVGPRRPSAYGHRQATRFSGGIARLGATVVSGLARGIDTAAHEAALKTEDGRTIAVIGSGFGRLYPEENAELARRIADGRGAILSELPFHAPPTPGTFPRRNRLVAALSIGVLVVEAGETSGALITARMAGELGRTVLVIPGAIDNPASAGANQLIRDGATLVASVEHVVDELAPLATVAAAAGPQPAVAADLRSASLSGREKQIYQLLSDAPQAIDDLARTTGISVAQVSTTLLSLELRRLVKKAPAGYARSA